MNTFNKFMVGGQADKIVIMSSPIGPIGKDDALILAAWLVALADSDNKFADLLAAVENT